MKRIARIAGIVLLPLAGWGQIAPPSPQAVIAAWQVALDRHGFSVGLIDDRDGAKTQAALADFKCAVGTVSDDDLRAKLALGKTPTFASYVVTPADLAAVGAAPVDWVEASQVARMAFESLPEVLSEKFHVSEDYLRALNPQIADWDSTNMPGCCITVPNVAVRETPVLAARLAVDCRQFRLRALDSGGRILASFPCSLAMEGKVVPSGALKVTACARDPTYTFDPKNYPESTRAQEIGRKLMIPAGPNNPVGAFWIGLNLPGFGIHGTPHPETIGCRESHGCFRLTNFDVMRLSRMVRSGLPVGVTGLDDSRVNP